MTQLPIERILIEITRELLKELHPEMARKIIKMDAEFESGLGLGSLDKAELLHRCEQKFQKQFSTQILANARTLNDLAVAMGTDISPTLLSPQTIFLHEDATPNVDVSTAETLIEVLKTYAEQLPDRTHLYLHNDDGTETPMRYGELWTIANQIAQSFVQKGLKPGETVALMLPTGKEFFYCFFGILIAGGIPVPIYPPFRADKIEEYAKREVNILANAEIRFLITFEQAEYLSKILLPFVPSLRAVITAGDLVTHKNSNIEFHAEAEYPALIQYTSGSTGLPKGVLLSHHNLLANIRAAGEGIQVSPTDVMVSWLPLYHDMGLIGAWLGSLYHGVPVIIMSPLTFLTRPERWLWTIHYHRATISAAPNFAYELCIRKIPDSLLEGLDLSSWRLAFNGAEAVKAETITRFISRFSRYGFRAETMFPVFGLAENAVALAFPEIGKPPRIDTVERDSLEKQQRAVAASPQSKKALSFVGCGKAIPEHEIRIVAENKQVVAERVIGELQFSGPSAMQGYYRNREATQKIYHEGWWDSGDYAYIAEGEIFITGRKKDLIIKAGRNIYPENIETIVNQVEGIRKGCVIAFGVTAKESGTEQLIIVAETNMQSNSEQAVLKQNIMEIVSQTIGLPPDQIILVKPGIVPKTSSGKLQRSQCKQAFMLGKLKQQRLPVWLQLSRLWLSSVGHKISRYLNKTARLSYALYLGLLLIFFIPYLWLSILMSSRERAAKILRNTAKLFLRIAGFRIHVHGSENCRKTWPMVFVANHASYVDALVLIALLPPEVIFVGKKELLNMPLVKGAFKKLNYLTVDRVDFLKNLADTQQLESLLKKGFSLVIFPEGTFSYATGLRPFKQGAFKIAVDTTTPVCPVALKGTRQILRDNILLPRRGAIEITICEPIFPHEQGWHEVVHLRNQAREVIAKYCGEQTLDLIMTIPHTS